MKFSDLTAEQLFDIPKKEEFYNNVNSIGSDLYIVLEYFNSHMIEDAYSQGIKNITAAAYYIGICSFIQLEHSMATVAIFNLEYGHAVLLRSYLEVIARTHKAVRLYKTYLSNKDDDTFKEKTERLVKPYIVGDSSGEGGFGITTLIDSLGDEIPDVRARYDELSEYLHGSSILMHSVYRKDSFIRLAQGEHSSVIIKHKELGDTLRKIFIEDISFIKEVTEHIKERMLEKEC